MFKISVTVTNIPFSSRSRIFHLLLPAKGCKMQDFGRHLWTLNRVDSFLCETRPSMTWDLILPGICRRVTLFSRLLRQARGYWWRILTRIPTVLSHKNGFECEKIKYFFKYFEIDFIVLFNYKKRFLKSKFCNKYFTQWWKDVQMKRILMLNHNESYFLSPYKQTSSMFCTIFVCKYPISVEKVF